MHSRALGILTLLALAVDNSSVFAQEQFFKDKTIRVVVGFSAGGGFDTYSRVIARYMGSTYPAIPH